MEMMRGKKRVAASKRRRGATGRTPHCSWSKKGWGGEMVLGFSLESAYGLFNDPTGLVLEPRAAEVLHFTGSNHWWGVWNTGVTAASGPPATPAHTENGF